VTGSIVHEKQFQVEVKYDILLFSFFFALSPLW
jgi:hypothetical protein